MTLVLGRRSEPATGSQLESAGRSTELTKHRGCITIPCRRVSIDKYNGSP